MAAMTVRSTVAFDPATAARLERFAKRWGVSKSGALRRSLAEAKINNPPTPSEATDFSAMTPLQILDWLAGNPQVPAGWGDDCRRELADMREQDAQIEEQRARDRGKVAEPSPPYST